MKESKHNNASKILMVSGGLGAGGKERQLVNLCKHLSGSGKFSVVIGVMNPGGKREQEIASFTEDVVSIPRLISADIITPIVHLYKTIKTNDIKVIHSWGSGIWDLVCLIVAKICHIPYLHGGVRSAPSTLRISHHISRWAAKHANVIVANSKAGLEAFRLNDQPHAQVIYNGLDFSRFENIDEAIIPNSIIMVSNFRSEKDHETLLLAMPDIIAAFPNTQLYLIGQASGTLGDIQSLIEQLGLTEQVTIITDSLYPEAYIAKCQIGILSTFGEGLSNVILEYMALSKPVVATNAGGNAELVEHEVAGFLVPLTSSSTLAERVVELLGNPAKGEVMGSKGRDRVEKQFSINQMGSAYEAVYEHLLGEMN